MQVNIVGVSGSPRKGATQYCVQEALRSASEILGISTHFIDLRGNKINHCIHCNRCLNEKLDICPVFEDDMSGYYDYILKADGIVLGSPVYHMSPSSLMQAFLNRLRPLGRYIGSGGWAVKVGGAIAVGGMRNGGQETTLECLNNFFFCSGMVVVSGGIFAYNGGSIWSNDKKEIGAKEDTIGMDTVRVIGRRTAIIAKLLKLGLTQAAGIEPSVLAGLSGPSELEQKLDKFRHR